jgi:hypothetical protein
MDEVQKYHATHAGRGPTGRLRNFGAMGDQKLRSVYEQVRMEGNDLEAQATAERHMRARDLWRSGMRVAPPDIEQEIWDTLEALAL